MTVWTSTALPALYTPLWTDSGHMNKLQVKALYFFVPLLLNLKSNIISKARSCEPVQFAQGNLCEWFGEWREVGLERLEGQESVRLCVQGILGRISLLTRMTLTAV